MTGTSDRVGMTAPGFEAGETIPPGNAVIEVGVASLRQLFNAIDPSPFHERDLDPRAEEFILDWSREIPRSRPLALRVHLSSGAGVPGEAMTLATSIHQYFRLRAQASRRRLKRLFREGRISLTIGLLVLGAAYALAELVLSRMETGVLRLLRESFYIGGWVAMWRPLEIFLYDWWPILAEARLYDRLAIMPVRIRYGQAGPPTSGAATGPPQQPVLGGKV